MNYSYENFEVMSDGEKADKLLTELAYRLLLKIKGASAETLIGLADKALVVYDVLERRENPEDYGFR